MRPSFSRVRPPARPPARPPTRQPARPPDRPPTRPPACSPACPARRARPRPPSTTSCPVPLFQSLPACLSCPPVSAPFSSFCRSHSAFHPPPPSSAQVGFDSLLSAVRLSHAALSCQPVLFCPPPACYIGSSDPSSPVCWSGSPKLYRSHTVLFIVPP
jgi:hypothetical protein